MKKIIRLTESDLARIVKRVIKEQTESPMEKFMEDCLNKKYYPKYILGSSSTEQKFHYRVALSDCLKVRELDVLKT